MRKRGSRLLMFCAGCGLAAIVVGSAVGQTGSGPGSGVKAPAKRAIKPYTAEFKTTEEQTLANGTTIRREKTRLEARDGQGRILSVDQVLFEDGKSNTLYSVHDPVARTHTNWSSNGKVVNVLKFPTPGEAGQVSSACPATSEPAGIHAEVGSRSEFTHTTEDLGTQVFEGLEAKGTRTTHTTPTGLIGNDAPLVRIAEIWRAKGYPITVRSITDDPQHGKTTTELTRFTPGEPDSSLFQPPAGYEIVVQESHKAGCEP